MGTCLPLGQNLKVVILNGAARREVNAGRSRDRKGSPALFTFVCIGISLLLIPDLATSQCVGGVLSEEGDDMAARGSQGGV